VIPWIIFAVVVVPLVVIAFVVARGNTKAGERELDETSDDLERTEREFAADEAYEAQWHEEDEKRFHRERLP
jgi:hypothetical protein